MADLLLELFSEEIPARMQRDTIEHLRNALVTALTGNKAIAVKNAKEFSTPRRLAILLEGLPVQQADVNTELKGPKLDAPEQAIQGFLKKSGMTREQLEKRDGIYVAKIEQKGKATAEVLKSLIEDILKTFPWPKSMRWGAHEVIWVRPLHSILCIFDGKVVPIEFGPVKAGNKTRGHRFLAPGEITINNPAEYEAALEKAFVIADREKRKAKILQLAQDAAKAKGFTLKDDIGLVEEVTGLVEWPVMQVGTIDAKFMDLPPEVLTTVMRSHQKYFSLLTQDGKLAPHFLITANTDKGAKNVVAGNERVLRARFSDARFFWDQDRKKPLSEWATGLADVTFHAKLGTIAEKVARIQKLAVSLASAVKADKGPVEQAARLCKADLVTGMVGEFAELQGIMGRYYATNEKQSPSIADAIRDHYLPLGPSSPVPTQPVSVCIALADKLDTLVSMFAIGEKPTGSKDPFALRRAALGVIRIILENNIRLPLKEAFAFIPLREIAIHKAHDKLVKKTEAKLHTGTDSKVGKYLTVNESACEDIPEDAAQNLTQSLLAFFHDRLIVQLKDSGIRHDVIKAVIADGDDDLVQIVARARALQDFLGSDDGANLLTAYKRAANIVAIEEKKDKASYKAADLKAAALKEKEEKDLAGLLGKASGEIDKLRGEERFADAMKQLSTLRSTVDLFFDKIMVNCDDKGLRAERLRLLSQIRASMDSIANFALIEG